ncbi:hypothetical protein LCGC14_1421680 [marine sediment metagenome]|uniref:Uncharacterized protein n=1 Tax=marine sediment metagenome TaxID=412755 RepID=A0A0F9JRR4_9ZZZZ
MQDWKCRVASSLGALEGTPYEAWGTIEYKPEIHGKDSVVFFGLYGLPDFYALWRHKGRKAILWCGSDLIFFNNGS